MRSICDDLFLVVVSKHFDHLGSSFEFENRESYFVFDY